MQVQGSGARAADRRVVGAARLCGEERPLLYLDRQAAGRARRRPSAGVDHGRAEELAAADPARGRALMHENRSYVVLPRIAASRSRRGPIGAQGVPLTPGPQPRGRCRLSCARHADFRRRRPILPMRRHALSQADDRPGRRLRHQRAQSAAISSSASGEAAGAIAGARPRRRGVLHVASQPLSRLALCLAAWASADTEHETDAELWARVARVPGRSTKAGPLPPSSRRNRAARPRRRKPAAASQARAEAEREAAPTARGEALDRRTARQLERGHLPSRRGSICTACGSVRRMRRCGAS